MSETAIMNTIRLALNAMPGVRFFRNNVGVDTARGVRYGLGNGSADLIGLIDGRFAAIEVKTPRGRISADQRAWHDAVTRLGGHACYARSVDDAIAFVAEVRRDRP